ncbi:hypothetical protein C8Q75DRAFT_777761 [Abortiporus biennis]|nr:hypothetical protein C8Q75DRAFT_777761 [Abortiporus biennis]
MKSLHPNLPYKESDGSESSTDTEDECSRTFGLESPFINLPLDAHLFVSVGQQLGIILPLFCVALEQDALVSQLTAILYQRRVLGSLEPAVGILQSRGTAGGTICLAWLESNHTDYHLPTMHISIGIPVTNAYLRNGLFDLTNANSALILAGAIQTMRQSLDNIMCSAENPVLSPLHWRSDIPIAFVRDSELTTPCPLQERVSKWLESTAASLLYGDMATPNLDQASPSTLLSEPSKKGTSVAKKSANSLFSQSNAKNKDNILEPGSRQYCFDRFVHRIPVADYDSTLTSLYDPEGDYTDIIDHIDGVMEKYSEMVRFECRPQIPIPYSTLLQQKDEVEFLVQAFKDTIAESSTVYHEYFDTVKLSTIFTISTNSRRSGYNISEADARLDIDIMLMHFFTDAHELLSPFVSREVAIHMPANLITKHYIDQCINPNTGEGSLSKICKEFVAGEEIMNAIAGLKPCNTGWELKGPEASAFKLKDRLNPVGHIKAFHLRRQVEDIIAKCGGDDASIGKVFFERAMTEPFTARCDSLLLVKITGALDNLSSQQREKLEKKMFQSPRGHSFTEDPVYVTEDTTLQSKLVTAIETLSSHLITSKDTDAKHLKAANDFSENQLASFLFLESESSDYHAWPSYSQQPTWTSTDLALPLAIVENKRQQPNEDQVSNQCINSCISAVLFLSIVIGIEDFPVWGIYSRGSVCAVIMAWRDSESKEIFVTSDNPQTYNLGNPVEALNFAIFLKKLRNEQGSKLAQLFDEVKDTFIDKIQDEQYDDLNWSRGDQLEAIYSSGTKDLKEAVKSVLGIEKREEIERKKQVKAEKAEVMKRENAEKAEEKAREIAEKAERKARENAERAKKKKAERQQSAQKKEEERREARIRAADSRRMRQTEKGKGGEGEEDKGEK